MVYMCNDIARREDWDEGEPKDHKEPQSKEEDKNEDEMRGRSTKWLVPDFTVYTFCRRDRYYFIHWKMCHIIHRISERCYALFFHISLQSLCVCVGARMCGRVVMPVVNVSFSNLRLPSIGRASTAVPMAQNGCVQVPLDPHNSKKAVWPQLSEVRCIAAPGGWVPPRARSLLDARSLWYLLRHCYQTAVIWKYLPHENIWRKSILRRDMQVTRACYMFILTLLPLSMCEWIVIVFHFIQCIF